MKPGDFYIYNKIVTDKPIAQIVRVFYTKNSIKKVEFRVLNRKNKYNAVRYVKSFLDFYSPLSKPAAELYS